MISDNARRLTSHLLILIALCCIALIGGCKKDSKAISLTLDWKPEPEFGGFYQAKLAGEFSQRGVPIELHNASGVVPIWKLVAEGQTDFATTSADLLVQARSEGADVVAIFAVYQTSPQGIMVHRSRGFTGIDDVFSNPGTLGAEDNTWLKYLLTKYPAHKVEIAGVPDGISVFMTKKDFSQQCFITSEPILAGHQGGDPQTFLIADAGFNPYVTVLITSGKILHDQPELVKNVVAACRKGWQSYLDDPSVANKEMSALNSEMDAKTFTEAAAAQKSFIQTDDTRRDGLGSMTLERWKTLIQQLADLKVIDKSPPAQECFTNVK